MAVQERVQRLKFSVSPDEQSANVTTHADRKYERQRLKYERLTKVLVSVKAGIQHLSERLEGVKLDEAPLVLTDENMVEVLQQCEQRLRIVLEAIRQEEEALVRDMGEAALQVPTISTHAKSVPLFTSRITSSAIRAYPWSHLS